MYTFWPLSPAEPLKRDGCHDGRGGNICPPCAQVVRQKSAVYCDIVSRKFLSNRSVTPSKCMHAVLKYHYNLRFVSSLELQNSAELPGTVQVRIENRDGIR